MNFYWTRSIPIHRYIQKGVGIWELGRTRDAGTKETIVLTKMAYYPSTPTLWTKPHHVFTVCVA